MKFLASAAGEWKIIQQVLWSVIAGWLLVLGDHAKSLAASRKKRMGVRHQEEWRCRKCFFDDVTSEMVFVTCQLEEE